MALVLALCAASTACSSSGHDSASRSAAVPVRSGELARVQVTTVPVPTGVEPSLPVFAPDGRHLVFAFTRPGQSGSQLGTVGVDGTQFTCVTCGLNPAVDLGKPFISRDGDRILVRSPSGKGSATTSYHYAIVECRDGILNCPSPTLLPVELPGSSDGVLQTRELRLSPDGQHIAFSQAREDGWTMLLGTLVQSGSSYQLRDLRVISPKAPLGPTSADWSLAGAFYEVKGFRSDGQSIIYASTQDGSLNYDDYLLDLSTGHRKRLTRESDWDEPLDISPDGETYVVGSSRGTHRIDGLSLIQRPPVFDFVTYAQTARWLLSTPARDCIVRPWLLRASTPDAQQQGQELDGGAWNEGYGPRAIASWSPDGTSIVFWDELQDPAKAAPGAPASRLRIAKLENHVATPASAARPTPTPAWAPTYDPQRHLARGPVETIQGANGGTATVHYSGNFVHGAYSISYHDYEDEKGYVLNGTETIDNVLITSTFKYSVKLDVSGNHKGSMAGQFAIDGTNLTGNVSSDLDGTHTSWPPPACPPPTN